MRWIVGLMLGMYCMSMASCKSCRTEADCSKDECCAAMTAHNLNTGRCLKLGKEKSSCNMKEEKLLKHGGKFMRACPCSEGYTCTARRGFKELVVGDLAIFLLKCQKTSFAMTPQNIPDKSSTDEKGIQEFVYEEDGVIDEDKIIEMVEKKSSKE